MNLSYNQVTNYANTVLYVPNALTQMSTLLSTSLSREIIFTEEFLRNLFGEKRSTIAFALDGEILVGMAIRSCSDRCVSSITHLAVRSAYVRYGVSIQLLGMLVVDAKILGEDGHMDFSRCCL
jgi:hypothetical protein